MHRRDFIKYSGIAIAVPNFDKKVEPIITRSIPSTGEKLPVIGMGTWRTFNTDHPTELTIRKKIIAQLAESGNKLIDSSPMYGRSESVIGDITHSLQNRSKFFIATKVWTNGKLQGSSQIQDSFKLMKTDVMDLMQVHNLIDVHTHLNI